ncbi:mercuric transporter MerT family protein [Thermosulfurimonas dismutans]|uniref:Mercuric transport protein MerT n=1 Tax=Thermosulfurimonas dismutans TaxID=999894 RepID=A0A179D454_9BACT|nr:mercuric transporter MerT family protein [Thermosulfurimonas dismutans]OAQ20864.1 Mercuric transport protein, MerT [Thermosulfurimonas dismutans]
MRDTISGLLGGIASLLAASCCVVPTIFVVFGVSISGLEFLTKLEPYRPYFLLIGYAAIAFSFYRIYHLRNWFKEKILKKQVFRCACEEPGWASRVSKVITWAALILLIVATVYPWMIAKIYE